MWDLAQLEPVQVVDGELLMVGVSEHAPSTAAGLAGQTSQQIKLLLPDGSRIDPPARLVVRGVEVRALGTQISPWTGAPSIVTCELVNPDLPDDVAIYGPMGRALDDATGRFVDSATELWSGAAHVATGVPVTVESAGVDVPLGKATVTLPLTAPCSSGLRVRIVTSRTPGVAGRDLVMSGEMLDSSAALRRVICYRAGG